MNPTKEAKIQKLETKIIRTIEKINILENRVQELEEINKKLTTKVIDLEKQQTITNN